MPNCFRRLRPLLRIVLPLLCSVLLLVAGGFWFLQAHCREYVEQHAQEIAAQSGLVIAVGHAEIELLPHPGLALSAVSVAGQGWKFGVDKAHVGVQLLALLQGRLRVCSIALEHPRLNGALPCTLMPNLPFTTGQTGQALTSDNAAKAIQALLPQGCAVSIVAGEADVTGSDGASFSVHGLRCDLNVSAGVRCAGRLLWDLASVTPPDALPTQLDGLTVEGETILADPIHMTPRLLLKGRLQRPDWLASLNLTAELSMNSSGQHASLDIGAALRKDGVLIPAGITGHVRREDASGEISLKDMALSLGKDRGVFDGTLRLGQPDDFALRGRLRFTRASLTQWLGFARNLPPGLQISLDALTEGVLDINMDGKGLRVPHAEATASGSHFTGTGGVASWAEPVVALNLTAPLVNLGRALPESVGVLPADLQYGHEALTPRPGRPVIAGEVNVGYDIRLNAARVRYGPLDIDDARVVIRQGLVDKRTRLEDTVLEARGKLYGGSVKGTTILGGSPETPFAIDVNVQNVDGVPLSAVLPVLPLTGGRLRGDVHIMSQGKKLNVFLRMLRGTVTVHAERGKLRSQGKNALLSFRTLDANFKARQGLWKQGRLGLDGQWKASLVEQGINAKASLNGLLWFGGPGGQFAFTNVPGDFSCDLSAERAFMPSGLQLNASGKFSCQADVGKLSLSGGQISALGIEAKGGVTLASGKEGLQWQGKMSISVPDMTKTLRQVGCAVTSLPPALGRLRLDAAFKGTPTSLALSEVITNVDNTEFRGSLALNWRKRPELHYNLSTPQLDFDRYIPQKKKGKGAGTRPSGRGEPWDFRFLQTFDAKGELHAAMATLWRLHIRNLRLAATLDHGTLSLLCRQGTLYDGSITTKAEILCDRGLQISATVAARGVDLNAASQDVGGNGVLGGVGSARVDFKANLSAAGQLPARLNGTWNVDLTDGSWQQRDRHGVFKGKPTRFQSIHASGIFMDGVVKNHNFLLKSEDMTVNGGGWVNLNKGTLDCNLNVNKKNVPDFPLRLYGSLGAMKTSIGAGTLLLNTLGSIAGGVVNIFGGLIQGTRRLFTQGGKSSP